MWLTMRCREPGGGVAVADGTIDQLHHFVDAIAASRAQMELKLNCTAQRMLGRCRLRLKTTTAQEAWVVRRFRQMIMKTHTTLGLVIASALVLSGCAPSSSKSDTIAEGVI